MSRAQSRGLFTVHGMTAIPASCARRTAALVTSLNQGEIHRVRARPQMRRQLSARCATSATSGISGRSSWAARSTAWLNDRISTRSAMEARSTASRIIRA
jgi:hypothetical protein